MRTVPGVLLLLTLASPAALAQGERSVTREMLDRARAALNDLQYARADSAARDVLLLALLPRAARAEALQILAAANFPEPIADRRADAARIAVTQLLRLDMSYEIPADLSTPALDSLYREVRNNIYAVSVIARRDNPITGINGTSLLRVRANRPSSFALTARTKDGIESILLDSVSMSTDTTLQLRVGRDGRLLLKGSEFEFLVTATNLSTREAVVRTFDGTVALPAIDFTTLPPGVDSTLLKPERSAPERTAGIVGGIVGAVATIAIGRNLRADDPIRTEKAPEGRYVTAAFLIAAGAAAASWFDRGRVLDRNIEANRRMVMEAEGRRRAAEVENARRIADYRANITLNTEGR